jgi:hypothetical protein
LFRFTKKEKWEWVLRTGLVIYSTSTSKRYRSGSGVRRESERLGVLGTIARPGRWRDWESIQRTPVGITPLPLTLHPLILEPGGRPMKVSRGAVAWRLWIWDLRFGIPWRRGNIGFTCRTEERKDCTEIIVISRRLYRSSTEGSFSVWKACSRT